MTDVVQKSTQHKTLHEKKLKALRMQEIFIWILTPLSIISLVFIYSPYFLSEPLSYYLFIINAVLVACFIVTQTALGFIRTTLARNFIIIEGIKYGKKVDQLIQIAQTTRFHDRISLGRRVYAIVALADLGASEAIAPLESLVFDKKSSVRKHAALALAEIKAKASSQVDAQSLDTLSNPYQDETGQYISLFDLEKGMIRHISINLISGLIVVIAVVVIFFSRYDLTGFEFSYQYSSFIMLFFIIGFYFLFILVLLIQIFIRMNRIKHCLETKDVFTLIQIASKPGFNILRYIKMAAISAIGDLGSTEAISTLQNLAVDRVIDIRSRAMTSLDMIAVKNNLEKRYYLEFN